MRNKNFNTIIAIAILALFSSCDNELTKTPYNSLTEDNIFSNPNGFSSAIKGVYAGFIDNRTDNISDYYGGDFFSVPDILTDNVILNQKGRLTKTTLYNWTYNSNGYSGFDLYEDAYKIVRKSNAIINNIDKLSAGDFKNNILGEALTARALAHFDLARVYAKIPTQDSNAGKSIGISYIEKVDLNQKPIRENFTVDLVYSKIIRDLIQAEKIINTKNDKGRFNKNTVNALLSRVYLYMGEWEKCIEASQKVNQSVAKRNNFAGIWKDENSDGIITEFLIRIKDDISIGTEYSQTLTNEIKSEYVISYDFYKLYKDNDVRKRSYLETSSFSGSKYNHIIKYQGKTGQVNGIVNAKVIRMAEVKLNMAEAYFELGKENLALDQLNLLRSERYENFKSNNESGDSLNKAIQLERRLELAFEGHRFFDLKRKGLSINRGNYGDLFDGKGASPAFKVLEKNNYKFQLPIPINAINANKGKTKQNPGY